MKQKTPNTRRMVLSEQTETIRRQLGDIREELENLTKRVRSGEVGSKTDATQMFGNIKVWLRLAMELEAKLAELEKRDAGIANSYAVDMDKARIEVGCRLARLRACCRS